MAKVGTLVIPGMREENSEGVGSFELPPDTVMLLISLRCWSPRVGCVGKEESESLPRAYGLGQSGDVNEATLSLDPATSLLPKKEGGICYTENPLLITTHPKSLMG